MEIILVLALLACIVIICEALFFRGGTPPYDSDGHRNY